MKRYRNAFFVLILIGVVIIILPCVRDDIARKREEVAWKQASNLNHAEDYLRYLNEQPEGRHVPDAKKLYEEKSWEEVKAENSVAIYEKYLSDHPWGKYRAQAKYMIDTLHWEEAKTEDSLESYQRYLQMYPRGNYVVQARQGIDDLHWKAAQKTFTVKSFIHYLEIYPDGRHAFEAQKMIAGIRSALKQNTRPLEGTVREFEESSGILTIVTSMGDTEVIRVTDDTKVHREEIERPFGDLVSAEGVKIDYLNVSDGPLLARKISLGHSISHCSCGQNCNCPLTKGCRVIRF